MKIRARITFSSGKTAIIDIDDAPFRSFQEWQVNFLGARWQSYNNSAYCTDRIDFIEEVTG